MLNAPIVNAIIYTPILFIGVTINRIAMHAGSINMKIQCLTCTAIVGDLGCGILLCGSCEIAEIKKTKEILQENLTAMREKLNIIFHATKSQQFAKLAVINSAYSCCDLSQKLLYALRQENINPAIVKAVSAIDMANQNIMYFDIGNSAAILSDEIVKFARQHIAKYGDEVEY